MRSRVSVVIVLTLAIHSGVIPAANAYIDAGTGSFLVQLGFGGLLGAGLAIKLFWRRLANFFSRGHKTPTPLKS